MLLIGASPVIGFGVTSEGRPRLREMHGLNRSRVLGGKQALYVASALRCYVCALDWLGAWRRKT